MKTLSSLISFIIVSHNNIHLDKRTILICHLIFEREVLFAYSVQCSVCTKRLLLLLLDYSQLGSELALGSSFRVLSLWTGGLVIKQHWLSAWQVPYLLYCLASLLKCILIDGITKQTTYCGYILNVFCVKISHVLQLTVVFFLFLDSNHTQQKEGGQINIIKCFLQFFVHLSQQLQLEHMEAIWPDFYSSLGSCS